jgi:hypothetical protein
VPPQARTSNGNLIRNETGLSGPVTSMTIDTARPTRVQMTHAARSRVGVRHEIRTCELAEEAVAETGEGAGRGGGMAGVKEGAGAGEGADTGFVRCTVATAYLPVGP